MKKLTTGALVGTVAAALAAAVVQQPATAAMRGDAPSQTDRATSAASHRPDNRPGPLTKQQQALRQAAVDKLASGKATKRAQPGGGSTVSLGKGKTVEFFDNKKQARVLSILSEWRERGELRPGVTDERLMQRLASESGITVSRRTVNECRRKLLR